MEQLRKTNSYGRDIRRSMASYIPLYYDEIDESRAILDVEADQIARLSEEIRDLLNQFSVNTATWALDRWERIFDIETDRSRTYEERRSVLRSRMRGAGTVTVAHIKEVAEAFDGGAVDVTEDYANYTVVVTFIDTRGVPTNFEDIQEELRKIIPAHLAINFEFSYLQWDELDDAALTWDELDAKAMTWDEFETASPEELA